jgi:N-methylhydantoinase A/oxoprolinase/acetone carboxylase beta subunit
VINASILPRMISTANMTEACVREAGVTAPLMIMRGDGGAMNIDEMRRRPAMTMLSGPAASVAGALMHLKVSDGIYFEVGGTSTNIAAIQNGKPNVKHAWVGGHETYVNSVDIRVLGIAGGSLISVEGKSICDVGPRSAHIAGLPYACFATESLADASIEPIGSELPDRSYVSLRSPSGARYALTPTCAANALGLVDVEAYSYGNQDAARDGFSALGRHLGLTADEAATAILDLAAGKVGPVIEELAKTYDLDSDQQLIIGVGGGAGALVPYVARKQGLRFEIAPDAEIISSIGAALAMIREVIERVIPHPTPEDIAAIRSEALEAAVRLGADQRSVDVTIELDMRTHLVRATASGAARMRSRGAAVALAESEAREVAAHSFGVDPSEIVELARTSMMRIFGCAGTTSVRVVDGEGRVRLARREMIVEQTTAAQALQAIASIWSRERFIDPDENPGFFALYDRHVIDVTHLGSRAQARALLERELTDQAGDMEVVLLAIAGRSSREPAETEQI